MSAIVLPGGGPTRLRHRKIPMILRDETESYAERGSPTRT